MVKSKMGKKEPSYMRFATKLEKELLALNDVRPQIKKGKAIIKMNLRSRARHARTIEQLLKLEKKYGNILA